MECLGQRRLNKKDQVVKRVISMVSNVITFATALNFMYSSYPCIFWILLLVLFIPLFSPRVAKTLFVFFLTFGDMVSLWLLCCVYLTD